MKAVRTSSSFSMIMEKALKMAVVGPARVMMRSGQFPSEMLIRAPLCREQQAPLERLERQSLTHMKKTITTTATDTLETSPPLASSSPIHLSARYKDTCLYVNAYNTLWVH